MAIADQACRGFGILGWQKPEVAIVHYLANLLLVTRGSLSGVPKFSGVVVPKMRTPQTGLTIRSFSLHVSYHDTEVEIMWRSVPWVNKDQNTLNILCAPWPKKIENSDFKPNSETFDTTRNFGYTNKGEIDIDKLVLQLVKLNNERCRVHIVVLPEQALNEIQHKELLLKLKYHYEQKKDRLKFIPMVITGITLEKEDFNAVNLAVYFSGKWYKLLQTKHHRWRLDRSQLIQYELTGSFSVERNWFENITIGQRRLSFFSTNGWLTLCPLICEDLAQLEPVSEVIRGVGPSLLIGLLMDGPQIKERWPARYASVFADDPGTAVLTLTSLGMLRKSSQTDGKDRNTTSIALWKDQLKGWRNVDILDADNKSTALLTISAAFSEEFTADGRSDDGFASVFKLDNIYSPTDIELGNLKKLTRLSKTEEDLWFGSWDDLRELTNLVFALDVVISSYGEHWDFIKYLIYPEADKKLPNSEYAQLVELLVTSYRNPEEAGIDANEMVVQKVKKHKQWHTLSLKWAVEKFSTWQRLFRSWNKKFRANKQLAQGGKSVHDRLNYLEFQVAYWQSLRDYAVKDLGNVRKSKLVDFESKSFAEKDKIRIQRAVPLAVLASLHNRMDDYRIKYKQDNYKALSNLFNQIEQDLDDYGPFG